MVRHKIKKPRADPKKPASRTNKKSSNIDSEEVACVEQVRKRIVRVIRTKVI